MLENTFVKAGTGFESFKEECSKLAEQTKEMEVLGRDLTFLSLCTLPEKQVPGKAMFYVFNEETIADFIEGKKLQIGALPRESIGENLLKELEETTGLMIIHKPSETKFLVSDFAIPTLSSRSNVKGDATISRQNIVRNLHFADVIIAENRRITFAYREENGVKKIFATMGREYKLIPQTIIGEMADALIDEGEMGDAICKNWSIDHAFTELNLYFPDMKSDFEATYSVSDITPGVQFLTSDIGRAGVIARGVFYHRDSYVVTDEVWIRHTLNVTPESVLEAAKGEIFEKLRVFPEVVATLIGKEVIDYSKLDLSSIKGQEENKKAMNALYNKCIRSVFKNDLPVKRQKALLEALSDEINPTVPYTLYDVAMTFMDLPDRVKGIDYVTTMNLRKACAKAPQIILKQAKTSSSEELYLV